MNRGSLREQPRRTAWLHRVDSPEEDEELRTVHREKGEDQRKKDLTVRAREFLQCTHLHRSQDRQRETEQVGAVKDVNRSKTRQMSHQHDQWLEGKSEGKGKHRQRRGEEHNLRSTEQTAHRKHHRRRADEYEYFDLSQSGQPLSALGKKER